MQTIKEYYEMKEVVNRCVQLDRYKPKNADRSIRLAASRFECFRGVTKFNGAYAFTAEAVRIIFGIEMEDREKE